MATHGNDPTIDPVLVSGIERCLAELTLEDLSSLQRVVRLGLRFAPIERERSSAIKSLDENASGETREAVAALGDAVIHYLDRAMVRIESGIRTWITVQIGLRLRELRAQADEGRAA